MGEVMKPSPPFMTPKISHTWELSEEEARKLQEELSSLVREEELLNEPKLVAGVDTSYDIGSDLLFAGVVVISLEDFSIVEKVVVAEISKFPYIPGLLSFRETPPLIRAFSKLKTEPDMIFVDGQGIAHPRFFGIASHIGVLYDKPTVGVAKSILVGMPEDIPRRKGEFSYLKYKGRVVGALLKSAEGKDPIVVSVGHRITLREAISVTRRLCLGFRIPEPTRLAHIIVNEERKKYRSHGRPTRT